MRKLSLIVVFFGLVFSACGSASTPSVVVPTPDTGEYDGVNIGYIQYSVHFSWGGQDLIPYQVSNEYGLYFYRNESLDNYRMHKQDYQTFINWYSPFETKMEAINRDLSMILGPSDFTGGPYISNDAPGSVPDADLGSRDVLSPHPHIQKPIEFTVPNGFEGQNTADGRYTGTAYWGDGVLQLTYHSPLTSSLFYELSQQRLDNIILGEFTGNVNMVEQATTICPEHITSVNAQNSQEAYEALRVENLLSIFSQRSRMHFEFNESDPGGQQVLGRKAEYAIKVLACDAPSVDIYVVGYLRSQQKVFGRMSINQADGNLSGIWLFGFGFLDGSLPGIEGQATYESVWENLYIGDIYIVPTP